MASEQSHWTMLDVFPQEFGFFARLCAKLLTVGFSCAAFRAGDITELKILEIPGPGDSRQCGDLQQMETGIPGVGCQVGPSQNGTGKVLKKPMSSSAPQSIPRRTDVKSQDIVISPQQQCSKSYMDRHMETLTQSKGFRRRHNSCEYGAIPELSCSSIFPSSARALQTGLETSPVPPVCYSDAGCTSVCIENV